jgi:hypothetical protein
MNEEIINYELAQLFSYILKHLETTLQKHCRFTVDTDTLPRERHYVIEYLHCGQQCSILGGIPFLFFFSQELRLGV